MGPSLSRGAGEGLYSARNGPPPSGASSPWQEPRFMTEAARQRAPPTFSWIPYGSRTS